MVDKTENLAAEYKKTEEELRKLAMDIVYGSVTTDRHCGGSREVFFATFMTVGFRDNFEFCKSFDQVTVYEYNDTPRVSGGFRTFKVVVNEDVDLLWELVAELKTTMQKFLQPDANSSPESTVSP